MRAEPRKNQAIAREPGGFSLIELLVSMTILSLMMLMMSFMVSEVEKGWTRARSRSIEFRDARNAFETIANRLSQARIDTYWDYEMDRGLPVRYRKSSHLHFVAGEAEDLVPDSLGRPSGSSVFFEAPFGMTQENDLRGLSSLLNGWGYFAGFGSDLGWQPLFARGLVAERHRFRLFEFHLPTEKLLLHSGESPLGYEWITNHLESDHVSVLAENVILFLVQPVDTLDPDGVHKLAAEYSFDSRAYELDPDQSNAERARNEIPPIIRLTMVAVAEADFARFQQADESGIPEVFEVAKVAPFSRAVEYEKDLRKLEDHLRGNRIDYRIFSTAIGLRSSKWTNVDL